LGEARRAYSRHAFRTMNKSEKRIEERFAAVTKSQTFKNIRMTFNLKTKSVLDIGCSYGEFLTHFGSESVGVTLAPEEAAYAREKGLHIVEGNIEDKSFADTITEKFDVIFANNILEHLYSPHAFLTQSKSLLKKDGQIILGVPCVPKITALMRLKKFRGSLASQHINFFTRDTLRLTLARAGWTVEEVRGFHIRSSFIDHLLDLIYPHFYAIARPDYDFEYSEKRKKELDGYKK